MNEIWKDINNFEGYYQISNLGRIRSLDRVINGQKFNGKIIVPFVTKIGYIQTSLYKDHKEYKKYIHRLMMETFYPIDGMENLDIDHIDRDKINNKLDNLRWVTHKENMHAWNPQKEKKEPYIPKKVKRTSIYAYEEKIFNNVSEAAKAIGKPNTHILDVCNGKRKSAYGYYWEYID